MALASTPTSVPWFGSRSRNTLALSSASSLPWLRSSRPARKLAEVSRTSLAHTPYGSPPGTTSCPLAIVAVRTQPAWVQSRAPAQPRPVHRSACNESARGLQHCLKPARRTGPPTSAGLVLHKRVMLLAPPTQHTHTGLDDHIPPADTLSQIQTADPATETEQGHVTPVPITGPRTHLGVTQTPSRQQAGPCIHIGDGLPPVPAKLVAKICRHEFVEMHELLPEFWQDQKGEGKTTTKAKKRALELTVWLQCFALYVGVLAPRFPLEVPELMAYMIAIIRAAQEYEGPAWAAYDAAYRRQAAAQGLTKWSQINLSLYAICFTGKAKKVDRCDRCLSATHKAEDCSLTAEDDPDVAKWLKAIESAVMALTQPPPTKKPRERSTQVCRNWNKNACSF